MCSRHGTPIWTLAELTTSRHHQQTRRNELREIERVREEGGGPEWEAGGASTRSGGEDNLSISI